MPTGHASIMPALRRVVLAGAADRTDGQLLGAFVAERDADAFGLLVRRHGPMVLGVCRRVIGDPTTAEDAFQAVFLVLARRAAAVRPREQVGNWLYGVAYRTALKARAVLARRRSREKQVDVMPEPPVTTPPDVWSDLQPVIDEELARLPEKLRGPVVLCDIEGRPQREVAKHLGVPPATLATRLATARRTLAQRLTKRGVTLSGGAVAGLLTAHGTTSAVPHTLAHGLTRAAEAVATGNTVSALVSASAVQLSEGVMRMMLLTKLKAVAVAALTAVALTGGLGLGLVPARADGTGEDPVPVQQGQAAAPAPNQAADPPANPSDKPVAMKLKDVKINLNEPVDDAAFLRRVMLDVCGVLPTDIEMFFFLADKDEMKRAKVVTWLLDDGNIQKAYAAKLLGLPAERVRSVQTVDVGEGKVRGLLIVVDATAAANPNAKRTATATFTQEGNGKQVVINETYDEVPNPNVAIDRLVTGKWVELKSDIKEIKDGVKARVIRMKTHGQANPHDSVWLDSVPVEGFFRSVQRVAGADDKGNPLFLFQDVTDPKQNRLYTADQDGVVRVWDAGSGMVLGNFEGDGQPNVVWNYAAGAPAESDLEFLKRVTMAARGTAPTALEEKYFTEDKDPKKREKLLDTLLKDPAVAKKLGDDFKKKMLADQANPNMAWEKQLRLFVLTDSQGQLK